mmetsp:Transcript_13349/g.33586  ORF Transcript_13349/g.33586 Transcript_13349/m.33586 type:complete len:917 (-) Transcript_13349:312-3062(-)|eukprot:CAMPEP_0116096146 /NCGR_PEP_ID=MMETSP0327-20121206/10033_1 /TAXON_ID=44447 /ORGANISM="Pseudo-nitzschia delicatissima, Strain B596" /LENGTH=916 /DNA_ID=CAMNT_0003587845 /DNA_START=230 /DNA_END=2980 /DNA_ORIENTATION=-
MRFEIALTAVLAAENLSSSGVSAQEAPHGRDIQERARLRDEAIAAFSDQFPRHRRSLKEGRPVRSRIGDGMRKISGARPSKLMGAVKKELQNQQRALTKKDDSSSDSDSLDLGILPSKPTKKEIKTQLLSNVQKLQLKKKETSSNPSPNGNNVAPDLGILPSISTEKNEKDVFAINSKIKKLVEAASRDRRTGGSSGDPSTPNSLPDLGIISSRTNEEESKGKIRPRSKTSGAEKDDRRLEEMMINPDMELYYSAPLAFMVGQFCIMAGQYCNICEADFVDENNPLAGYSIAMGCVEPEGAEDDVDYFLNQIDTLCSSYGLCKTSCDVDVENFIVDMKDCSVTNVDGLQDNLGGVFPSDGGTDIGDILGDYLQNPIALAASYTCDILEAAEVFNEGETPFCNSCEVTYLPKIGDISPYNVEIDCPFFPDEQDDELVDAFGGFNELCSYGICQSCVVDSENFKVDLKNCSFASFYDDMMDMVFDYYNGNYTGGNYTFSFPDPKIVFDSYFSVLCNSEDTSCGACGSNPTDESAFSFELNCPSVLSASGTIFNDYLLSASLFCTNQAAMGLKCSACEVDPWDASINIGDCVVLTEEEISIVPAGIRPDYDLFLFGYLYSNYCQSGESEYLQDLIENSDCICTFDASAKTASVSCQYNNECDQYSSYCWGETFEFCDASQFTASLKSDRTMSYQQCYTLSSGSPNNDQFNFCVEFERVKEDDNITTSQLTGCEMEVEGVSCNSCSTIQRYDSLSLESSVFNVGVYYNCSNTVLGSNGNGNLSDFQIIYDTFQYFIYGSLPCSGGCDLCGVGDITDGKYVPKDTFMTKPDGVFATEIWKDNVQDRCFDAQLDAMTLKQPLSNEQCQRMRDAVSEPCGCKNPNPPPVSSSGANSISNRFSASMSSVLFTIAAASIIQVFIS